MVGEQVQEIVSRTRARVARAKANLPGPGLQLMGRSPAIVDRFPMLAQAKARVQTRVASLGRGAMLGGSAAAPGPGVRQTTPYTGRKVKTV